MAETHIHIFFVFPNNHQLLEIGAIRPPFPTNDFSTLLVVFFDRLTSEQQSVATMILWSLWKNCNFKLWENTSSPSILIVQRAKDILHEWWCIQHHSNRDPNLQLVTSWSKPPPTHLKCNVDCALFQNNFITGYGFCFRNPLGHLVLGVSNFIHQSSLPIEAEALGLFEAIKFAIAENMSSVIFESDCKIIVDIVNSPEVPNN